MSASISPSPPPAHLQHDSVLQLRRHFHQIFCHCHCASIGSPDRQDHVNLLQTNSVTFFNKHCNKASENTRRDVMSTADFECKCQAKCFRMHIMWGVIMMIEGCDYDYDGHLAQVTHGQLGSQVHSRKVGFTTVANCDVK